MRSEEIREIEDLLRRAVLTHLTDDELARYHDGVASDSERYRIEAHLKKCLTCWARYERMRHILATYHEVEVPLESVEEVRELLKRIPPRVKVIEALRAVIGLVLLKRIARRGVAFRSAEADITDGQTEDGILRWRIVDEPSGELIVRLWSHCPTLEGVTVKLRIGELVKDMELKPVMPEQVGAEVRIPARERNQLPEDAQLVIDDIIIPE